MANSTQVRWLRNGVEVTRESVLSTLSVLSFQTTAAAEALMRGMHHEAVVCGVSEGFQSGVAAFKCEVVDAHDIEADSIAPSGHYYGCHVFTCDGVGCILPADHCDCGFIAPLAAFLERLAAWIRSHTHHAHVDGERIVIGIATVDREQVLSTSLEYVRTMTEARDALGY
jgi:hypothetical protein